ncbi:AMP-binding protein [Nannocystaceae bacterium ST9]
MSAQTVADLLRERAETRGGELALRCRAGEAWREHTWASYWAGARRAAAGLWARGIRPGAHVLMLVTDIEPAILAMFGAWSIGAVPIQVGLPFRASELGSFVAQLRETARRLDADALVLSKLLVAHASAADLPVFAVEDLLACAEEPELPDPAAAATRTALIQLTSGSTGRPRGVVLGHDRLMHHLGAISRALPSHAESAAVSWLPLHHDMGLIGGLLFPFFNGFVAHMMSPLEFRAHPLAWLEVMAHRRATICAAPPSAYAMTLRLARRAIEAELDLSRWECAMIGAEPISAELLRRFADAFAPTGFRAEAFFPVYGLAEATVAVSFPRLLAPTRIDRVDRATLEREGEARPFAGPGALELVAVGRAIPGTELRVVDAAGADLPERHVGELRVRAASLMQGYYAEPSASAAVLAEGWLHTGDLGYVAEGELFITGRSKDLIIRGGLNLIPTVIEELATEVDGVRPGGVAAVGVHEPELETQLVHLVAETRLEPSAWPELRRRLVATLEAQGVTVDRIVLVAPGTLPRTTSGKLRRREIAEALARGDAPGS